MQYERCYIDVSIERHTILGFLAKNEGLASTDVVCCLYQLKVNQFLFCIDLTMFVLSILWSIRWFCMLNDNVLGSVWATLCDVFIYILISSLFSV